MTTPLLVGMSTETYKLVGMVFKLHYWNVHVRKLKVEIVPVLNSCIYKVNACIFSHISMAFMKIIRTVESEELRKKLINYHLQLL